MSLGFQEPGKLDTLYIREEFESSINIGGITSGEGTLVKTIPNPSNKELQNYCSFIWLTFFTHAYAIVNITQ